MLVSREIRSEYGSHLIRHMLPCEFSPMNFSIIIIKIIVMELNGRMCRADWLIEGTLIDARAILQPLALNKNFFRSAGGT